MGVHGEGRRHMSQHFLSHLSFVSVLLNLAASTLPAAEPVHWIGTWATATQPARLEGAQTFRNQTLRLIVHTSTGGKTLRIRLSNVYGEQPLVIGRARVARRASGPSIDPATDRPVSFGGHAAVTIAARSAVVSDPVDLEVAPLSDLSISLFLPQAAVASTSHALAKQTNYVSAETGDATAETAFPVARTTAAWPFLTGVDVTASAHGASIVAFGSSTTDGDGSTTDANRRWPDVLAERLSQHAPKGAEMGVLNEGIIGNRLLFDSPRTPGNPFGPVLGEAGLARLERDVLDQPGVRFVIVCLGVNDILFPAFPFTPANETVTTAAIVEGYRQLIARAHARGVRVIGSTIPPFEGATFAAAGLNLSLSTPEREAERTAVNEWIRGSGHFDGLVDFDVAVRDPERPTRLRPSFAAPDRLHVNDAGNVAQGDAISLSLFEHR
jgi:lysophospholipase L1-like esterase